MPYKDLVDLKLPLIHCVLEFLNFLAENVSVIKEILREFTMKQDTAKLAY